MTGAAPDPHRLDPPPESLLRRIRSEPHRAPEHLALAAAQRFAAPAARWGAMMRAHHDPGEAARTAVRKHVHLSRLEGLVLGAGGALTTVPDIVALAWVQSRMVFFTAAALGHDPADPMRPAELLVLQQLYPTAAEARAALDGVGRPLAVAYVESRARGDEALAGRLLKAVGRRVARRAVGRLVPVVSAPLAARANGRATAELGRRALAFYERPPAP